MGFGGDSGKKVTHVIETSVENPSNVKIHRVRNPFKASSLRRGNSCYSGADPSLPGHSVRAGTRRTSIAQTCRVRNSILTRSPVEVFTVFMYVYVCRHVLLGLECGFSHGFGDTSNSSAIWAAVRHTKDQVPAQNY